MATMPGVASAVYLMDSAEEHANATANSHAMCRLENSTMLGLCKEIGFEL